MSENTHENQEVKVCPECGTNLIIRKKLKRFLVSFFSRELEDNSYLT